MDSAEETEAIKRHNTNPFSFCIKPLVVIGLLAVGYFCGPAIIYLVQAIIVWYRFLISNIFYVFVAVVSLVGFIIFSQQQSKTAEEKADLYDQYELAVRTSSEYNYRVTEVEDDYNNNNSNNSSYKEIVAPVFQAVKEYNCCDRRAVMEEVSTKSYRRTSSEKKMEKKGMRMMEYRRTESERVSKTASWRSETMDGLSSEEFRMTVETFITEKKKMLLWQNGGVDRWQNGVPQWQNGVPPWQGWLQDGSGRHHRPRSRSQRLVGGSGPNGSGSYLAISN